MDRMCFKTEAPLTPPIPLLNYNEYDERTLSVGGSGDGGVDLSPALIVSRQ